MSTTYPTSKQSFTNPAPGDVVASALIGNLADTVEALEDEVGLTSPSSGTLRKRVADLEAAGGGGLSPNGSEHGWGPLAHGFKAWAFDCVSIDGGRSYVPNSGDLVVVGLYFSASTTVTNVHFDTLNTPTSMTAAYGALYSSAGALLAQNSSSAHAQFSSAGVKTFVLSTPQVVPAGKFYVAFWGSASAMCSFAVGNSIFANECNLNLSAANARFATANTGLTSTAPSTIGTKTALARQFWAGVS